MTDVWMKVVSGNGEALRFDIDLDGDDLAADNGFATAIAASLFSWARDSSSDYPAGFWGDSYPAVAKDRWGSLIRRLWRSKDLNTTRHDAQEYARDALAWLVTDKHAASVDIAVDVPRRGVLRWKIRITTFDERRLDYLFDAEQGAMNG